MNLSTFLGEIIYDVVLYSINGLLRADLTASWEKGLTGVADGKIKEDEYMEKLSSYITRMTEGVKGLKNSSALENNYRYAAQFYSKSKK